MPTKTPDHVIKAIEGIWAQRENSKAKDVLAAYKSQYNRRDHIRWVDLSLRRVQEIIAARRRDGDGSLIPTFERKEWKPWCADQDSETSAFLLTMDAVCQAVQSRRLYDHEAKWGMRLRVALQGLTPYDQFYFVTLYAIRDVQAHYAQGEPFTADLNAILAYKPWLPENAHAYGMATAANLVPKPLPGSRDEISFEDAVDNRFTGKAWETLRVDLRPPWYIYPEDIKLGSYLEYALSSAASWQERAQEIKEFTLEGWEYRFRDTALQFWMGDNPIFEKPQLHGMLGLIELRRSDIKVPGESNTHEEAPR